jgi:spoIIIJ-associated protein
MAERPQSIEADGKSVDDAVLQALRRLRLNRAQVDVSVISEGRPGVFGIGATPARVRVSERGAAGSDDASLAPLPKIDDYADYQEVDRRPHPRDRRPSPSGSPSTGGRSSRSARRDGAAHRDDRPRDDGRRDSAPRESGEARGRSGGSDRPRDDGRRDSAPRESGEARGRSGGSDRPRDDGRRDSAPRESGEARGRGGGGDRLVGRSGGRGRGGGRAPEPIIPREPLPFKLIADPDFEPEDEQPTAFAQAILTDILNLMGIGAQVSTREPETPMDGSGHAIAVLDISLPDSAEDRDLLIGRHGEQLAALQYVVNLIINRTMDGRHAFTVDVAGYKRSREAAINAMANEAAREVRETHETAELEPMNAAERRVVHLALADDPELETESSGTGNARRVQIVYRGP